jgi:hypothetical protein
MKKENFFIISEYDKFNKQTTTRTLPMNKYRSQSCIVWDFQTSEDKRNYSLGSNIRHVKSPDSESLILDFDLIGESWIFFRNGSIQLICDDENLTIQANESYSNTESGGGINENFYYRIDQDILKKICDSKELSIRLNGDQQVELKKERLEVFQIMCQQFYNNFYDHKLYIEALSKSTKRKFTFNFKYIVVIIAVLLSLWFFYFEPNLSPEKVKIEQIDNNEIYSTGTNIAEGVAASLAVGFSSIDSGLTYEVKTSNDVFTSQGNTWPIIDVSIIVNSEILSNPNITFVLFLEIDNSSGTKAGTVKNIKVDGLPDPSLELMNNTMYIKTVEGIEQVKLIDGELRIVEYNIPDNTNNTITNVIETPSEIDSSDRTQKLMYNYYISILKDKKFINIRKTPVNGEIVEKVSGGDVFTVINEFETPDPVYLLNKKILLTDINTGETIEKPLGFKLNSIKNISDSIYYAEITNIDKSINKVVIYESNFTKSKSRWLYLKEVNGWIYSDFCRIIPEQTFKSSINDHLQGKYYTERQLSLLKQIEGMWISNNAHDSSKKCDFESKYFYSIEPLLNYENENDFYINGKYYVSMYESIFAVESIKYNEENNIFIIGGLRKNGYEDGEYYDELKVTFEGDILVIDRKPYDDHFKESCIKCNKN